MKTSKKTPTYNGEQLFYAILKYKIFYSTIPELLRNKRTCVESTKSSTSFHFFQSPTFSFSLCQFKKVTCSLKAHIDANSVHGATSSMVRPSYLSHPISID